MEIRLLYDICHCLHGDSIRKACFANIFVKGKIFKAEKMLNKSIGFEWCSGLKSHKESHREVDLDTPGYKIEFKRKEAESEIETINYWIPLYLAEEIIEEEEILIKPVLKRFSMKEFLKEIQKY